MAVLLTVLRILGIVFLVMLILAILLILLVLFAPLHYSFSGELRDPEGSSELLHLDLKKDVSFQGAAVWLLGAVRVTAAMGPETAPEGPDLQIRVLGFRVPLEKILQRRGKEKEKQEGRPPAEKEKKTLDERIDAVLDRIEGLYRRIEYIFYLLDTKCGIRARKVLTDRLLGLAQYVLPGQWGITGVLGLGDPARSAKVFAVQGFLYPVTAGHVRIGTEYELYRYDLQAAAQGKLRVFPFVRAGLALLLNRDVRKFLRKLRRGPTVGRNVVYTGS